MNRLVAIAKGLGSALLLALIVVGLPAVLIAYRRQGHGRIQRLSGLVSGRRPGHQDRQ